MLTKTREFTGSVNTGGSATKPASMEITEYDMDLFDVTLHYNLVAAARGGRSYDIRKIFDGTLAKGTPGHGGHL